MSFLHEDKNIIKLLVNSGQLEKLISNAQKVNATIATIAKKLLNNLKNEFSISSEKEGGASATFKDLTTLKNLIDFLKLNNIKYYNKLIIINQDKNTDPTYIPLPQEYMSTGYEFGAAKATVFIYKDGLIGYLNNLKDQASIPPTDQKKQTINTLVSHLISEANEKLKLNIPSVDANKAVRPDTAAAGDPGDPSGQTPTPVSETQDVSLKELGPQKVADIKSRLFRSLPFLPDIIDVNKMALFIDALELSITTLSNMFGSNTEAMQEFMAGVKAHINNYRAGSFAVTRINYDSSNPISGFNSAFLPRNPGMLPSDIAVKMKMVADIYEGIIPILKEILSSIQKGDIIDKFYDAQMINMQIEIGNRHIDVLSRSAYVLQHRK